MQAIPEIPFFLFALKAVLALAVLVGGTALVGMLIFGVIKHRPGIAAVSGALLLFGLLLGIPLLYLVRSMPFVPVAQQSTTWEVHSPYLEAGPFSPPSPPGPTVHYENAPTPIAGRISFFGLFLIVGGAIAAITFLSRRFSAGGHACGGGKWWPAFLLIPPVLFLSFWGTARMQSIRHEHERPATIDQEQIGWQQAEFERQRNDSTRQAAKMNEQLQQHIATMDIHELMDMVDAPRIMLPMPAPATLMLLAKGPAPAPEALSLPPSATVAVSSHAEDHSADVQLIAKAKAGVASVVGEDSHGEDIHSHDSEETQSATSTAADGGHDHAASVSETVAPKASPAPRTAQADESHAVAIEKETESNPMAIDTSVSQSENRPDWVNAGSQRIGDTWREVFATDEYVTAEECFKAANVYLLLKTYEHIQTLLGSPDMDSELPTISFHQNLILADGNVIAQRHQGEWAWHDPRLLKLTELGINIDYIRREAVTAHHLERTQRSVGEMKKLYTQIEFTPNVDGELRQRWDAYRRQERFATVGVGAGSVLGLLGLTYGLLKVDTWTKGYYTKRLFLGVPAAIIGFLGLLALLGG